MFDDEGTRLHLTGVRADDYMLSTRSGHYISCLTC
jgi:hypothetical protein